MKKEGIFFASLFLIVLFLISSAGAVPLWSGGSSNATATTPKVNDIVKMSVNLAANATLYNLSSHTFSWNNSGSWVNDSAVSIDGNTSFTVTVAKPVTATGKPLIGWRVFFNDSLNNKNATDIFTFSVVNTAPTNPSSIALSPDTAFKNSVITATASGSTDADGDAITYLYQFRDSDSATILQAYSTNNTFNCAANAFCSTGDTIYVYAIAATLDANSTATIVSKKISPKLSIADLDVSVDGRTDSNLRDGETVDKELKPLSKVEVKVKVKNEFTDDEDLDIDDITVKATITDIADGEDLEEESNEFDLSADRTKTLTFDFNIPLEVDEGSYDLIIDADGKDDNGTRHVLTWKLRLNVEKKEYDVRIYKKELFPDTVDCSRNSQLSIDVVNFGSNDYGPDQSNRVLLRVENQQLSLNVRTDNIFLSDDLNSDDSHYKAIYQINAPSTLAAGAYPISIRVDYGTNFAYTTADTVALTIKECTRATANITPPVVVVQQPQPTPTPSTGAIIAQPPVAAAPAISTENLYILLLVLANVVLLGIGIALIVRLARR